MNIYINDRDPTCTEVVVDDVIGIEVQPFIPAAGIKAFKPGPALKIEFFVPSQFPVFYIFLAFKHNPFSLFKT